MMHRRACAFLVALLFGGVAAAQSSEELFRQGVDAFQRGDSAAAADAFKSVLASNPGHGQAFEMLDTVEQAVLMDMLVSRGELGDLTERFLAIARLGRLDVVSDPGGAADVVGQLLSGDFAQQHAAMLQLQSRYGQWSVPALVGPLGDSSSMDNRVRAMQALRRLGSNAVLPLIEVLESDDVLTRSNAAAVLGSLGDQRALAALAWMARNDADGVARTTAAEALGKMGQAALDPVNASLAIADGYFRGAPELTKPYDSSTIFWKWEGGALRGEQVLGGLLPLMLAEELCLDAMEAGAGSQSRALLAAVHAAQKAEILAAQKLDSLSGHPLLDSAADRLVALDRNIALGGSLRGQALIHALSSTPRRVPAAVQLMDSMGGSALEVQALASVLGDPDAAVSQSAAMALGRLGQYDGFVAQRLGEALAAVPQRIAVSIGTTGLGAGAPGWQVINAASVQEGLLRAKAFPPKDVVLIQDGLQGVTLDALIFGLRNDPRTADTPIIVVTHDVDGISGLYDSEVQSVVTSASYADLAEVAGEPSGRQVESHARARKAANVLLHAPPGVVQAAASSVAQALRSGADTETMTAILNVVAHGGLVEAQSDVESMLADDSLATEVRVAAMHAAARIWSVSGTSGDFSEILLAAMDEGDDDLSAAAAAALGELQSASPATLRAAVR